MNGGILATPTALEEACLLLGIRPSPELVSELFKLVEARWSDGGSIDFGVFTAFVTEIRAGRRRASISLTRCSKSPFKRSELLTERTAGSRNAIGKQVFLGGSCNPTTWRKDVAVPALEEAGVTFFNPQAGSWSKEMIEIEEKEKTESRLLLFVIDNQTRSIGSMVETAYLSASGHEIVAVINDFQMGAQIGDHVLTVDEVHDLNSAHDSLRDALHKDQVPLFSNLDLAMRHLIELLRENRSINILAEEDFVQAMPVRATPSFPVGGMVATMANIFTTKDKRIHVDHLTQLMNSRLFGLGMKVSEATLMALLKQVRACMKLEESPDVGFFEFSGLVLELHRSFGFNAGSDDSAPGQAPKEEAHDVFLRGFSKGEVPSDVLDEVKASFRSKSCSIMQPKDDAFCYSKMSKRSATWSDSGIGSGSATWSGSGSGTGGSTTTTQKATHSHTKTKTRGGSGGGGGGGMFSDDEDSGVSVGGDSGRGVDYSNDFDDDDDDDMFGKSAGRDLGAMLRATEAVARWDACRVLLFNISSNRRAIDKCIEAAHAIGVEQKPVVLCIDPEALLTNLTNADGVRLDAREAKDLSRGRHYLQDIAKRHGTFLTANLEEAVAEAIRLATET